MGTNHAGNTLLTSPDSLGEQIGLLKSISETGQVVIIVVSLLSWGFFWQLQMTGGFVFVVGCLATTIGLYILSLNFGDSLHVFERGLKRRNNSKERLIQRTLEQCSGTIQLRLMAKLKADGEVLWKDNVNLTQGGLKIVDPVGARRVVPFTDIEELLMKDNQLKIWKRGDAMPFMVLSNDSAKTCYEVVACRSSTLDWRSMSCRRRATPI